MASHYLEVFSTPSVIEARKKYYGKTGPTPVGTAPDPLTDDEIDFIHQRDSFYMASINEDGWPYVQHRGGPTGFLKVTSPTSLAFADFKGNRQLISVGNFAKSDRVSLFLMDYPQRTRLKILGHARVIDARERPDLVDTLADPELRPSVERIVLIEIVSFDWNCQQHITPRFTREQVEAYAGRLQERIRELEAQIEALRKP